MPIIAQEEHTESEEHHMKDPGWEAVLSGIFNYDTETKVADPGIELHVTYWFTHKWAFGTGYSMLFEEHGRIGHELAALVSSKPWEFLTINVGPSFSMPNSHHDLEVSAYVETEFAIKIGEFHTGPTIGSLIGEHFKIFGGLHMSYEF